jgi:hypothetical protein
MTLSTVQVHYTSGKNVTFPGADTGRRHAYAASVARGSHCFALIRVLSCIHASAASSALSNTSCMSRSMSPGLGSSTPSTPGLEAVALAQDLGDGFEALVTDLADGQQAGDAAVQC